MFSPGCAGVGMEPCPGWERERPDSQDGRSGKAAERPGQVADAVSLVFGQCCAHFGQEKVLLCQLLSSL